MGKLAWSDPKKEAPMKNQIPQGKFAGITKRQKSDIQNKNLMKYLRRSDCIMSLDSSSYCISKSLAFSENVFISICRIGHAHKNVA